MDIRDTIKATNTAIAAVDLVKDYGSGNNTVHALRGVNVAFEKGKFTAIMGPSGSGKSTLMHTLAGLDSATSGHIMFDGKDLTRMNDAPADIAAPSPDRLHLPKLQPAGRCSPPNRTSSCRLPLPARSRTASGSTCWSKRLD
ncbi:ABC transporter ATP-binding protein [Bifidobacterium adolescentis]|nr:ABC transporter ATP-binding protein [Bifidobacterium adolescentis]